MSEPESKYFDVYEINAPCIRTVNGRHFIISLDPHWLPQVQMIASTKATTPDEAVEKALSLLPWRLGL